MRVLLLVDSPADLEGEVELEDDRGFVKAYARRDVNALVPRLDWARIQPQVYALCGGKYIQNWLNVAEWRRLAKVAQEQGIELIHGLGLRAMIYAALARRLLGIPSIASCYTITPPDDRHMARSLLLRLQYLLMRIGIDRVIVPSDLVKRSFVTTRYPMDRVEIIYPGVEFPDLAAPPPERSTLGLPEGPLAVTMLSATPDKGYDIILDALPRLLQRVPEAKIAVVGAGTVADELQQRAQAAQPPLQLTWLGQRPDVKDIIRASDIVIAHPRREGLPYALVEAAVAAKPVVATRVAGVTEIVEQNITGFLVTPGDSRDFAVQIGRLMTQPALARQTGQTARRHAEARFSLDAQRETTTVLYEATVYESR